MEQFNLAIVSEQKAEEPYSSWFLVFFLRLSIIQLSTLGLMSSFYYGDANGAETLENAFQQNGV